MVGLGLDFPKITTTLCVFHLFRGSGTGFVLTSGRCGNRFVIASGGDGSRFVLVACVRVIEVVLCVCYK